MIGVTAAASAGVYLGRGYIDPGIAMPVMLGVLAGSLLGAKVLVRAAYCGSCAGSSSAVIVALAIGDDPQRLAGRVIKQAGT